MSWLPSKTHTHAQFAVGTCEENLTLGGQSGQTTTLSVWRFPDLSNELFFMDPQIMNPCFKAMILQKIISQPITLKADDPQTSTWPIPLSKKEKHLKTWCN